MKKTFRPQGRFVELNKCNCSQCVCVWVRVRAFVCLRTVFCAPVSEKTSRTVTVQTHKTSHWPHDRPVLGKKKEETYIVFLMSMCVCVCGEGMILHRFPSKHSPSTMNFQTHRLTIVLREINDSRFAKREKPLCPARYGVTGWDKDK